MDIFSKIAAGEIPSYKCAESEKFYAFLDINPVVQAHTLVIPRREVDYIFDMEDDELAEFEVFAKRVAKAIRTVFPCKKVAQVVLGLEVPHAHIHLLPINSEGDVDFHRHVQLSEEEMKATAEKILAAFNAQYSSPDLLDKRACKSRDTQVSESLQARLVFIRYSLAFIPPALRR